MLDFQPSTLFVPASLIASADAPAGLPDRSPLLRYAPFALQMLNILEDFLHDFQDPTGLLVPKQQALPGGPAAAAAALAVAAEPHQPSHRRRLSLGLGAALGDGSSKQLGRCAVLVSPHVCARLFVVMG